MARRGLNLPNIITVARILVCPVIFMLALSESTSARFWAFVLFVIAAVSDLWDGYLARKHGWITDLGKLLDPIADKLLIFCTLIPLYMISHSGDPMDRVPWWGVLPLWVVVVILGREIGITVFRSWAAKHGVVIAAGQSGKYKAFIQNLFVGSLLLWYPLLRYADASGWIGTAAWSGWTVFHGAWVAVSLTLALVLTVYSMFDYLWSYRSLAGAER